MLTILKPGLQTTLQGAPRLGVRHFGVPYAGPADALSMALANRLVGNPVHATSLEVTYGGFLTRVESDLACAVTGAISELFISGTQAPPHTTLHLKAGDELAIAPVPRGARTYIAVASGLAGDAIFGSTSTYLPAKFGGLEGRALRAGDRVSPIRALAFDQTLVTPAPLQPVFTDSFALRACTSTEIDRLSDDAKRALFRDSFTVGRQATRMGISLEGVALDVAGDGMMKSAPVFPGTVQCPASGVPIILLCDAQTTGGYPRIAQVARCDRHLLGQIRPGNIVTLLERTPEAAARDHREKHALFQDWLAPSLGENTDVLF